MILYVKVQPPVATPAEMQTPRQRGLGDCRGTTGSKSLRLKGASEVGWALYIPYTYYIYMYIYVYM